MDRGGRTILDGGNRMNIRRLFGTPIEESSSGDEVTRTYVNANAVGIDTNGLRSNQELTPIVDGNVPSEAVWHVQQSPYDYEVHTLGTSTGCIQPVVSATADDLQRSIIANIMMTIRLAIERGMAPETIQNIVVDSLKDGFGEYTSIFDIDISIESNTYHVLIKNEDSVIIDKRFESSAWFEDSSGNDKQ